MNYLIYLPGGLGLPPAFARLPHRIRRPPAYGKLRVWTEPRDGEARDCGDL